MDSHQPLPPGDHPSHPDEPEQERKYNDQGEDVLAYIHFQPDWAQTLLEVVTNHPFVMAKNEDGKVWHVLPTGELLGQDCHDVPTAEDFPLWIIKDIIPVDLLKNKDNQDNREADANLVHVKPKVEPTEQTPDLPYVKPNTGDNNKGHVRSTPKTLAAPPKTKYITRPVAPPQFATPIEGGELNLIVHPHAGFLSAEDWNARAKALKAVAKFPMMSVRTYYKKELLVRAIGSPAVALPQPFLPEGTKSTAIAITVNIPYTLVVAARARLHIHTGLEIAYTGGCTLEIVPSNIDPHDDSIWQDQVVPGLKPVQRDLALLPGRPFTPVAFDIHNSFHCDVQQMGNTPIATLILRVRAMIPKAPSAGSGASASSDKPAAS
jgi:hypothetical protein